MPRGPWRSISGPTDLLARCARTGSYDTRRISRGLEPVSPRDDRWQDDGRRNRRGFDAATLKRLRLAYRYLYRAGLNTSQALDRIESELGGPTVKHYVLSEGGRVEFGAPLTEYQHYVLQGCAAQNHPDGSLLNQDTAWFVPCNAPWGGEAVRKHSICHAGEGAEGAEFTAIHPRGLD